MLSAFIDSSFPSVSLSEDSQTGRAHLLLISSTPGKEGGAIGIVTLEGKSPLL